MDFSLLPVLMEPKGFVVLVFLGVVVIEGFAAMKAFVGLGGLIRTGALLFADPLPLARFAHVLPQYACTITPSLYLGVLFRCLGGSFSNFTASLGTFTLTSHNEWAGVNPMFMFAFVPALVLEPPTMLELGGKPGNVLGAAHALEQNR